MNYIINPNFGSSMTGMVKPKKDIAQILSTLGYKDLEFKKRNNKISRLLFSYFDLSKLLKNIGKRKMDILVIQYPLYSRMATRQLFKILKNRKVKKIAFIHDIEALRANKENPKVVNEELKTLNKFDTLIVHNNKMKEWLISKGISCKIIELGIFDYLNDQPLVHASLDKDIIFAGNLAKAPFLQKLYIDKHLVLFGVNQKDSYPKNIDYLGAKDPDELPLFLDGSFGLVWDGDEIKTNAGILGEYTRYNNPHKVSLYLSSGLPVIVWSEAAIARFIIDNKLGISVDSLAKLDDVLRDITLEEYDEMVNNVRAISEKLRSGFFTKRAINKLL